MDELYTTGWEVQIDTETGKAMQTSFRRSEMNYLVFLPASSLLVIIWVTGICMFLLPRIAKVRKVRHLIKM